MPAGDASPSASESQNPSLLREVRHGDTLITLLGTAHISRSSADQVARELDSNTWSVHLVEEEFHRSSSSRCRRHDASASSARRARSASSSSISSV